MIIYREIMAGARQRNVLYVTAVVTENVTCGVTHFVTGSVTLDVTGGVTHLVTGGVTFIDTKEPGSTDCNSISCEYCHLGGVTLGVTFLVTLGVTFLVTGYVTLRVTTKKEKNKRKKKFPLHPLKKKKKQKKKKQPHIRACMREKSGRKTRRATTAILATLAPSRECTHRPIRRHLKRRRLQNGKILPIHQKTSLFVLLSA
ncbi:MAG: hypothetical protein IKQ77_03035 [Prevotella sp.]|nr:hypothetical protein [Prevotella sp.]